MKVYQYGLLPPVVNGALVSDQMSLAHKYRNTLVEIEVGRRNAIRSAIESDPGVAAAKDSTQQATDALKREEEAAKEARSVGRTQEIPKAQARKVGSARKLWKEAYKQFSAHVREAKSLLADEITRINAVAHDLQINARKHCGVYWGTYLIVERAMDASRKQPLYHGAHPQNPSFVSWGDVCHHVGVQLQKGQSVPVTFGTTPTQLRIERDGTHPKPMRDGSPRRGAVLSIRVASDKGKAVWATFPMILHRDLPKDGDIRLATISRRRVGPNIKWTVELVVGEPVRTPVTPSIGGAMAMDIGWRQKGDGGLKLASWVGEDGRGGEVILNTKMVSGIRKAQELAGLRKDKFNLILDATRDWVRANSTLCPAWLTSSASHMHDWRSIGRLAALARRWRKERFEGDATGYDMVEAWRYHDQHLWSWECAQREKSLGARREQYRVLAVEKAREYDVLVIEDFNLSAKGIAQHKDIEKGPENLTARSNRQLAGVSFLRLALVQAFLVQGRKVVKVPPEYTSKRCNVCKKITHLKAEERYVCEHCGSEWDRDENARANLMDIYHAGSVSPASGCEPMDGGQTHDAADKGVTPSETAPVRKAKWVNVKRKKGAATDVVSARNLDEITSDHGSFADLGL